MSTFNNKLAQLRFVTKDRQYSINDMLRRGLDYEFGNARWLGFDCEAAERGNRKTLKIHAGNTGVHIRLDISEANGSIKEQRWFNVEEDTSYDLTAAITTAAEAGGVSQGTQTTNGRDYYIYLAPDGTSGTKLVVSCNSTFPNDVDASCNAYNTRKIGQFHTLCENVGNLNGSTALSTNISITDAGGNTTTNNSGYVIRNTKGAIISAPPNSGYTSGSYVLLKKYNNTDPFGFYDFYNKEVVRVWTGKYYDVLSTAHPLNGFSKGDILPESVWCLSFRPKCSPDGMVYDVETDMAIDIYLQSGHASLTKSKYRGTHTVSRPQMCHQDDMRQVGKRLLYDHEFTSMAQGSNERTALGSDSSYVGGHSDSNSRRMISSIGVEEACGFLWQWLEDVAPLGYGTAWGNTNNVYMANASDVVTLGMNNSTTTNYTVGQVAADGWKSCDGQDSFGAFYYVCAGLLAGGHWGHSSFCGSRARNSHGARSNVAGPVGGRGACRVLRYT